MTKKKRHIGTSLASLAPDKPRKLMRVQLGKTISEKSRTLAMHEKEENNGAWKAMTGTIVYIHPKGRYFTVEYKLKRAVLRESFKLIRP